MTLDHDREDALLAAIYARPDDDAPRLVYADWLDDAGRSERAEFIRVQCQTAAVGECATIGRLRRGLLQRYTGTEHAHRPQVISAESLEGYSIYFAACECRRCQLERRSNMLLGRYGDRWLSFLTKPPANVVLEYRRGFIEALACPAASWFGQGFPPRQRRGGIPNHMYLRAKLRLLRDLTLTEGQEISGIAYLSGQDSWRGLKTVGLRYKGWADSLMRVAIDDLARQLHPTRIYVNGQLHGHFMVD